MELRGEEGELFRAIREAVEEDEGAWGFAAVVEEAAGAFGAEWEGGLRFAQGGEFFQGFLEAGGGLRLGLEARHGCKEHHAEGEREGDCKGGRGDFQLRKRGAQVGRIFAAARKAAPMRMRKSERNWPRVRARVSGESGSRNNSPAMRSRA